MSIVFSIVLSIFLAFVIDSAIEVKIPNVKDIKVEAKNSEIEYKRFLVKKNFKERKKVVIKKPKKVVKKEYIVIKDLKLSAIFATSQQDGYIIFTHNKKSYMLGVKEEYQGYKLTKLFEKYVIFTKNNKDYKLSFKQEKVNYTISNNTDIKQDNDTKKIIAKSDEEKIVKRDLINKYISNPIMIWKNIAIDEYRERGKLVGFKVNKVNKNSVFEKLGLKRGDIIKEANNIRLNSIENAFKIYRKINNISSINLVIIRNNQEMELNYEIE